MAPTVSASFVCPPTFISDDKMRASAVSTPSTWFVSRLLVCQNRKPTTMAAAKRKNATAAALNPNAVVDAAFATRSTRAITDRISCAPNRVQQRLVEVLIDLRTQTGHVHV